MDASKILIAEDDVATRRALGLLLARKGYDVVSVEDGYEALDFTVRERPDLLLLDVHMPAGDGFSVHEHIMQHPEVATKPVIFMTHDRSAETEAIAQKHAAYAIIYKPFESEDLLAIVEDALQPTA